jgi:acetyl-CoA carboxylase biotin carboxyl carrier protein
MSALGGIDFACHDELQSDLAPESKETESATVTVTTVLSPLPGIFYRKPAPDQPPYKNQGDAVTAGDTICLIEVMKTFTPVIAEHTGTLRHFLIEDEDEVMAGQPLYEIEV